MISATIRMQTHVQTIQILEDIHFCTLMSALVCLHRPNAVLLTSDGRYALPWHRIYMHNIHSGHEENDLIARHSSPHVNSFW